MYECILNSSDVMKKNVSNNKFESRFYDHQTLSTSWKSSNQSKHVYLIVEGESDLTSYVVTANIDGKKRAI